MDAADVVVPSQEELVTELKELRRVGIVKLASRRFPLLERTAVAAGRIEDGESLGPYSVERMLRDAVAQIGGDLGDAAATILGLDGGRAERPSQLRRLGAEILSVSVDRFRQHWEGVIFDQVAYLMLSEVHDYRLRLSRLRMDVRTPVGSRLAVEWLSRFEAMYAIWTPVIGVGGDLTGYRSTLLEPDRPWDRESDPNVPADIGYSQELQAAGYVTDAFYHFAHLLVQLRRFETKFGGLWLLPEAGAETDLASIAYRIVLASPNNEYDDSYLRRMLGEIDGLELAGFMERLKVNAKAKKLHDEWQEWASGCECEWELGKRSGREHYPTAVNNAGISEQCSLHTLIEACNDYMMILDDGWDQIADWYVDVPEPRRADVTAEAIYGVAPES